MAKPRQAAGIRRRSRR